VLERDREIMAKSKGPEGLPQSGCTDLALNPFYIFIDPYPPKGIGRDIIFWLAWWEGGCLGELRGTALRQPPLIFAG